ncbi:MAG: carboxypeptidase regulatory-like domain-containing protein [Candidatus Zixiibacteriota bacterium]|nr:MAG: carboxypeptidase regulatory-like domain-containing protein [candidate division Zixibacteria bacterium]
MPFLSQPGVAVIAGVVTDDSLNPIDAVIVHVEGQIFSDTTDINGEYMIAGLQMGYCDISFSHDLYDDSVVTGLFAVIRDTAVVDMVLFECTADNYVVGDVNESGDYNGLDIIYGVAYFKGGDPPPFRCICPPHGVWHLAGDVNASCSYNGLDITYGVNYLKGIIPERLPCPDCPPIGS